MIGRGRLVAERDMDQGGACARMEQYPLFEGRSLAAGTELDLGRQDFHGGGMRQGSGSLHHDGRLVLPRGDFIMVLAEMNCTRQRGRGGQNHLLQALHFQLVEALGQGPAPVRFHPAERPTDRPQAALGIRQQLIVEAIQPKPRGGRQHPSHGASLCLVASRTLILASYPVSSTEGWAWRAISTRKA
jgi:hypothetical protein